MATCDGTPLHEEYGAWGISRLESLYLWTVVGIGQECVREILCGRPVSIGEPIQSSKRLNHAHHTVVLILRDAGIGCDEGILLFTLAIPDRQVLDRAVRLPNQVALCSMGLPDESAHTDPIEAVVYARRRVHPQRPTEVLEIPGQAGEL